MISTLFLTSGETSVHFTLSHNISAPHSEKKWVDIGSVYPGSTWTAKDFSYGICKYEPT